MDPRFKYSDDDSFVIEGKLALPYQYFAGRTGSNFLIALRDQKKILGTRCAKCRKVFVPPRQACDIHITDMCTEWVEVSGAGTATGFTVVRYAEPYQPVAPPYILALIKLDGADNPLVHIIKDIPPEKMRTGLRVRAVFSDKKAATILNIDHFAPA